MGIYPVFTVWVYTHGKKLPTLNYMLNMATRAKIFYIVYTTLQSVLELKMEK